MTMASISLKIQRNTQSDESAIAGTSISSWLWRLAAPRDQPALKDPIRRPKARHTTHPGQRPVDAALI